MQASFRACCSGTMLASAREVCALRALRAALRGMMASALFAVLGGAPFGWAAPGVADPAAALSGDRSGLPFWLGAGVVGVGLVASAFLLFHRAKRVAIERAIKADGELFRALVDSIPGTVYRCELAPTRRVVYVSESVTALTGLPPSHFFGKDPACFEELIPPEENVAARLEIDKAIAENRAYDIEYSIRHADGSLRWAHERGRALVNEEGVPTGIEGVILDVTQRRRAEEAQKTIEIQLQHAQKLEGLGVLAGGIAHDFNNLLTAIIGNIDVALEDIPPGATPADPLLDAQKAAMRAAELCQQLVAYSGRGRFVVHALSLNTIIEEMGRMLQASLSKEAMLRMDLSNGLPAIEADPAQMRQVIMNLIINASEAIDALPAHEKTGIIRVATGATSGEEPPPEGFVSFGESAPGLCAYVEVTDTGVGMEQAMLQRIFDPFFTTKFAGRGLGLAAVLGIVRSHKGLIQVRSEMGKGSTFRAIFPAIPEAPEAMTGEGEGLGAWRGSGTVMLVDDEDTVRATAKRMLERLGFRVIIACDGREALAVFRQALKANTEAERLACVILDVTMPVMGGEEALTELRRISAEVPIVLSSGYTEQEISGRLTGECPSAFIQKPYHAGTLGAVLRGLLDARTLGAEKPPPPSAPSANT